MPTLDGTDIPNLLDDIAERALDDDYYSVRTGRDWQSRQIGTAASAAILGVFAMLITIVVLQNQQNRPVARLETTALQADVDTGQRQLADSQDIVAILRRQVAALQSTSASRGAGQRVHVAAGDRSVVGPGIVVRLDPKSSVIDETGLQGVVNALWAAGAEAVELNGNRVSGLTSIGQAAGAFTVNFRSIGPPYVFAAIGNQDDLRRRFAGSAASGYWSRQHAEGTASFGVADDDDLRLPAAPSHRTSLRFAAAAKGAA